MEQENEQIRNKTLARLNRIEGQVRGIRKMIEDERSCMEVLRQLAATDAALRAAAKMIITHHLERCFAEATQNPDARKRLFEELMETFGRFG